MRLSEKQAQWLFQIAMDTYVKDSDRVIGGMSTKKRVNLLAEILDQQNDKVKELKR